MQHASFAYPSHLVPILEAVLFLGGLIVLFFWNDGCKRWSDSARERLSPLVTGTGRAVLFVGLLAGAGNAGLSWIQGPPVPEVSDEWSYLLAGDTFASGRITNPASPHPALVGENVIGTPTYQSKYPPANGLMLAAGERLGGHPAVGLWLSAGLLAAACTWCFQAWVPPGWAMFGGLLLAVRLGLGSYWNQSYWGGSVAAIGGALLFGAVKRLLERPRLRHSLLAALGLALLAASRPLEGLLVSLPAAWMLGRWFFGLRAPERRAATLVVVLPLVLLLLLTASGLAYYNWCVTGDALLVPHFHYKDAYQTHSEFVWKRRSDAGSPHQIPSGPKDSAERSWWSVGFFQGSYRVSLALFFILSPALAVPLLFRIGSLESRYALPLVAACLLVLLSHFAVDQFYPHYSAPLTAPMWILALMAFKSLYEMQWRQRSVVENLSLLAVLVIVTSFLVQIPAFRSDSGAPSRKWEEIRATLEAQSGQHLVLFDVGLRFNFNSADLWGTDVLWAFDDGSESNAELFELFPDRKRWRMILYGSSVELQSLEVD